MCRKAQIFKGEHAVGRVIAGLLRQTREIYHGTENREDFPWNLTGMYHAGPDCRRQASLFMLSERSATFLPAGVSVNPGMQWIIWRQ